MRGVVRGIVIAASVLVTGCSILAVRGPPKPCTDDYIAPGVDTGLVLLGVAAAVANSSSEGEANAGTALNGLAIIIAVPATISALVGYSKVSACRDLPHETAAADAVAAPIARPSPSRPPDPAVARRKQAWALYEEALRSHDCAVVRVEGARIRALDLEFYRHQFLADERVRACFARPGADPAPAPVAPKEAAEPKAP